MTSPDPQFGEPRSTGGQGARRSRRPHPSTTERAPRARRPPRLLLAVRGDDCGDEPESQEPTQNAGRFPRYAATRSQHCWMDVQAMTGPMEPTPGEEKAGGASLPPKSGCPRLASPPPTRWFSAQPATRLKRPGGRRRDDRARLADRTAHGGNRAGRQEPRGAR